MAFHSKSWHSEKPKFPPSNFPSHFPNNSDFSLQVMTFRKVAFHSKSWHFSNNRDSPLQAMAFQNDFLTQSWHSEKVTSQTNHDIPIKWLFTQSHAIPKKLTSLQFMTFSKMWFFTNQTTDFSLKSWHFCEQLWLFPKIKIFLNNSVISPKSWLDS